MAKFRIEIDSMGEIAVPKDCLWGAQTQRSLEHFCIGDDLMPKEMIPAYAIEKKACALVNYRHGLLSKLKADLIIRVCDEITSEAHNDHFPLYVWMTGSGTQFNMNVNEVIANRCSQIAKKPLGSKQPVHPNDDVNFSQSSNDSFPTVMNMAAAIAVKQSLIPGIKQLRKSLDIKAKKWKNIVKLGRTHLQDATPLTLGQEFSGYVQMLGDNLKDLEYALQNLYFLTLGGTAVGTGLNTFKGFDREVAKEIAKLTKLPFKTAKNKFAVQGGHNALVGLSGALKTLAVTLQKIAGDIRLLSCGPRAGFYELIIPSNEPGSSIMPGKINPTQCESLSMIAYQVMANDLAVTLGGAGGELEMNVYKPLIIFNVMQSLRLLSDGCRNFEQFLVREMQPNLKKIEKDINNSLMLVTALTPKVGYDKAAQIAKHAFEQDISLKEAAWIIGQIEAEEFDRMVDPFKMCFPSR